MYPPRRHCSASVLREAVARRRYERGRVHHPVIVPRLDRRWRPRTRRAAEGPGADRHVFEAVLPAAASTEHQYGATRWSPAWTRSSHAGSATVGARHVRTCRSPSARCMCSGSLRSKNAREPASGMAVKERALCGAARALARPLPSRDQSRSRPCRAVRVIGSRAEVVPAARAPAAAPAGALDYESAQCDAERPERGRWSYRWHGKATRT
jgi:hypothetical protein